jgi:hypothetical protein
MAANPESILDSVKKVLGFEPEYTAFDIDVLMFINSTFGTLQQLGVGSDTGFFISDNTTLWAQYVSNLSYQGMVKVYMFMAVRLAFDPPATSFGIGSIERQLELLAWRINVAAEADNPPTDPFAVEEILDASGDEVTTTYFEGGVMPQYFAPKVKVLDYAATVTPDAKSGNVFYLTLTGPCTLNAPVNGVDGEHITLGITSAGFPVTWGNGWNFGDAGLPTLTNGKTDIVSAVYRESQTRWLAGFTPGF